MRGYEHVFLLAFFLAAAVVWFWRWLLAVLLFVLIFLIIYGAMSLDPHVVAFGAAA